MYKCELHGELESEWCDDCEEIVQCDCSHVTEIRFKDLEYDCTDGPRTFTMYLLCCETCGNRFDIRLK
jgi:hypothetical protein